MADALERPSLLDGRVVVLICLLLYFGALARCIMVFGDVPACWLCMGAPEPLPFTAADLIIFPPTVRYMDEGGDAYSSSPYDPALQVNITRSFNYPRIWLILPRLGLTEENVGTWRLAIGLMFFLSVISLLGKANFLSGIVAAAAICSPSVMFAVERGNTDLWVFIVLTAAIFCFNHRSLAFAGYGVLLFAAILKLYPALTFITVVRERTLRRGGLIGLGLAASFAGYLYWIRGDLKMISRATPQLTHLSFGRRLLFLGLSHRLHLGTSDRVDRLVDIASLAFLIVCIGVAWWAASRIIGQSPRPMLEKQPSLIAFWVGAITFTGVFATAISFDYRLIFLLLTVPQIFSWVRNRDSWGAISIVALAAMLANLWLIQPPWTRVGVDQLLGWILFVYFITALFVTLPVNLAHVSGGRIPHR